MQSLPIFPHRNTLFRIGDVQIQSGENFNFLEENVTITVS